VQVPQKRHEKSDRRKEPEELSQPFHAIPQWDMLIQLFIVTSGQVGTSFVKATKLGREELNFADFRCRRCPEQLLSIFRRLSADFRANPVIYD
jgi:hypothetical protein